MNKEKIIFTDLDKTLLTAQHEISEENLKALYQLQNKGFIVVFASGRSYNDIKINLLEKYHLQIPIIALNGAQIYLQDGFLLANMPIKENKIFDIIDQCNKLDYYYILYDQCHFYYHKSKQLIKRLYQLAMTKTTDIDYALYGMQVYYDIIFSSVPLTKQIINDFKTKDKDLFKLEIITHDFKFIESINKKYDKDFKITSSGQLNTEISSLSVTKANAIDILCKHFNINLENTYAIGDHLNDLEMLKKVNYSGAVNNAVDDVKKIVNYISTSYDKNGFANFAYHIMK